MKGKIRLGDEVELAGGAHTWGHLIVENRFKSLVNKAKYCRTFPILG
jgi:hypothetical protein